MPLTGNAWQRALQAADSAGRLLEELSIDPTRQVDVFSICEEVGLWLAFLPMDGLLGAFVPEGAGGVMITNRRPITVQRYTAAHELGHWRLERPHGRALALALDGEEHIFGATSYNGNAGTGVRGKSLDAAAIGPLAAGQSGYR